jgi:hypothetical protein
MTGSTPSPMYQALSSLCAAVEQEVDSVARALQNASTLMADGNGDVWTGSAAEGWARELSWHSADLSTQAYGFLDDVRSQLASQPQEVSVEEAHVEAMILSGRLR